MLFGFQKTLKLIRYLIQSKAYTYSLTFLTVCISNNFFLLVIQLFLLPI